MTWPRACSAISVETPARDISVRAVRRRSRSCQSSTAPIVTELGRPNLVVFNAGAYERGDVIDIHPDDFDRCWRVGCFWRFLVGPGAAKLMPPAATGTHIFTVPPASLRGGPRVR